MWWKGVVMHPEMNEREVRQMKGRHILFPVLASFVFFITLSIPGILMAREKMVEHDQMKHPARKSHLQDSAIKTGTQGPHSIKPPVPWADPKIPISPPLGK